ncbi:MAG TPA: hypothetical protein VNX68_08750, partial [Nitrosopumilaceae archaeon]|nr:hypothetical protein [Nitrosopumilaceae archaeon]
MKKPKTPITQLIPGNSTFIIESDNFQGLFKKLNETNLLWEELKQIDEIKELNNTIGIIDSLISTNQKLKEIFTDNKVYMSACLNKDKNYDYLFGLNLPDINYEEDVLNYFKANSSKLETVELQQSKEKIHRIVFKSIRTEFYIYINSGSLLLCKQLERVEDAILSQNKMSINLDKDFMKLEESAGSGTDFRLFVNHLYMNDFKVYLNKKEITMNIFNPSSHKGWTGLDVELNPNEVIFNGFTLSDSSMFL